MRPEDPRHDDAALDDAHWARLDDYFAGRLPLAERVELERWIAEREDRQSIVAQAREVWERAAHAATPIGTVDIREVLGSLAARREAIDAAERRPARVLSLDRRRRPVTRTRRLARYGMRAAAALVVAVGLGLVARVTHVGTPADDPMRELVTQNGQRAEIRLADGSRVLLGVESKLRVPADFGRTSRDLYLDGEAYFDVTHDETRIFRVHTAQGVAKDLGTRFTVRAYPGDSALVVAVTEGVVALKPPTATDSVVLGRGDLGHAYADGRLSAARDVDLDRYLAWMEGRIVFEAVPLPDALRQLERWFDVEIQLADPELARLKLNGSYRDASITEVIRDISLALNVRAERSGRVVTLTGSAP